jgi:hypothetical protein
VILITTERNQLSGTIPTEIGRVTVLTHLFLRKCLCQSLSIHQQHHCHSSPYCPFFVILITTDYNELSGTIPTEIGQMIELEHLDLGESLRSGRSQFTNNTIVIHRHIVHFL